MSYLAILGKGNWVGILSSLLIVFCFYFTLTYFEHLRYGDERTIKQTKFAAVICIALALILPAILSFIYL